MRGHVRRDGVDLAVAVDHVRSLAEPGVAVTAEEQVVDGRDVIDALRIERLARDRGLENAIAGGVAEAIRPLAAADLQATRATRRVLEDLTELVAGEVDADDGVLEWQHRVELPVHDRSGLERR